MNEVSSFRLYVLRAMYLFIVAGLGVYLWPGVLNPQKHWELMEGMESCMLAAFSFSVYSGCAIRCRCCPSCCGKCSGRRFGSSWFRYRNGG